MTTTEEILRVPSIRRKVRGGEHGRFPSARNAGGISPLTRPLPKSRHNTSCQMRPLKWSRGETARSADRYASSEGPALALGARRAGTSISERSGLAARGGRATAARGAGGAWRARVARLLRRARPANAHRDGAWRARLGLRCDAGSRATSEGSTRGGVSALRLARRAACERAMSSVRTGARCQ